MNKIVIKKPIITEKAMKLANNGEYTFEVLKKATKQQIAQAVSSLFKVTVEQVKTVNIKGEKKMQRKVRGFYWTSDIKKAIVKLAKGQTLELFETPKEETTEVITAGEHEPVIQEKKSLLKNTKVRIEKGVNVQAPKTQRKVIPG